MKATPDVGSPRHIQDVRVGPTGRQLQQWLPRSRGFHVPKNGQMGSPHHQRGRFKATGTPTQTQDSQLQLAGRARGAFAKDLQRRRQRPLGQIHNVHGFVNPHTAVGTARGQFQSPVAGGKFQTRHRLAGFGQLRLDGPPRRQVAAATAAARRGRGGGAHAATPTARIGRHGIRQGDGVRPFFPNFGVAVAPAGRQH